MKASRITPLTLTILLLSGCGGSGGDGGGSDEFFLEALLEDIFVAMIVPRPMSGFDGPAGPYESGPYDLQYAPSALVGEIGVSIEPMVPSYSGGLVDGYAIEPPLPPGLHLDPLNGTISGSPTQTAPESIHTVAAYGTDSSAFTDISIRVDGNPWATPHHERREGDEVGTDQDVMRVVRR